MKHPKKKQRSCAVRLFIALLCASLALSAGIALAEDGRMIGLTVSDDVLLNGDAQEMTLAEDLDIVTSGVDGGIGVDIFTNNDPVSVAITGDITVLDQSETGFEAMGIRALAYPGGDVTLAIDGNVSVKAESQSEEAAAYGVQIGTNGPLNSNYYEDENGARLSVHSSVYPALPVAAERNGVDVTEEFAGLYAFFAKETDGWVLYLVTEDGDIRSFSQDVMEEDAKLFAGYVSDTGVVTQGPITVTLHTTEDDPGDIVTIWQASGSGHAVAIDVLGHYYMVVGLQQLVDPATGKTYVLQAFDPPQAWADLAGSIHAEATADAIGLDVKTGAGPVDVTLRPGTMIESRGAVAAGIYVSNMRAQTILRGQDVTIRAKGALGQRSEALGIWLVASTAECTRLTLTGNNHIEAATGGTPQRYAAGILSSGTMRGTSEVYYEGDIDVSGAGMIGVQAIANQGANVRVSVIGDVRLQGSDRDGLYVKLAGAVPRLGYVPQGEIYLRGSVTVTNARDEAAGVSAIGGVVIVDGDVTITGEGGLYGIYADESATVLVTGEISAPIAVLIPSDSETIQNDSNVYVWKYDDTSIGKTERIGFVLKLDEGVEAELESDSDAFLCLTRQGKSYYGAKGGDTVTVITRQTGLLVLDADGNSLPTEQTEGGFRFTVPNGCGVSITAP